MFLCICSIIAKLLPYLCRLWKNQRATGFKVKLVWSDLWMHSWYSASASEVSFEKRTHTLIIGRWRAFWETCGPTSMWTRSRLTPTSPNRLSFIYVYIVVYVKWRVNMVPQIWRSDITLVSAFNIWSGQHLLYIYCIKLKIVCDLTVYSVVQYKDAFLKENPTYKWYNPTKHSQPVAVSKSVAAMPTPAACTSSAMATSDTAVEQISAGKLAGDICTYTESCIILYVMRLHGNWWWWLSWWLWWWQLHWSRLSIDAFSRIVQLVSELSAEITVFRSGWRMNIETVLS